MLKECKYCKSKIFTRMVRKTITINGVAISDALVKVGICPKCKKEFTFVGISQGEDNIDIKVAS